MRASRRTTYAASRMIPSALFAAVLSACLAALCGEAMAQAPVESKPDDAPNAVQPEPDEGAPPRREHDRARDAVREGQSLPLGDIIRDLQRTCPGTFLNAALDERDGRLVYRLQTLSTSGRRLFTIVDAATGAIVSGGCR